jgi:hypothetical protein
MSIRPGQILAAALVLAGSTAMGAAIDDVELRNWPAPTYWGPSVTLGTNVARHPLDAENVRARALTTSSASAPFFFVSVTACRMTDTRPGHGFSGQYGPPALPGGTPRDFTIVGQCGIPASAAAVSFNFTVVNAAGSGFMTAFPAGASQPTYATMTFAAGQTISNASVTALGSGGAITIATAAAGFDLVIDVNGYYALSGDRNPSPSSPGNDFAIQAGGASVGATDTAGGNMTLAGGIGTGLGGGGNVHLQTSGADDLSGTTDNVTVDRRIIVGKAKQLTLSSPGFTSLMSIHLVGTHTAGGRIFYVVRATDGGSQIATEEGVIQYLATANSITCTVQTADKLHLGTVNSGCTPGFFNPGSQPGVSIFDNVTFSSPAPIVVHEVYFTIENESGSSIRLEP